MSARDWQPGEAEVEAAARALYEEERNESMGFDAWPEYDDPENVGRHIYEVHARAALIAAHTVTADLLPAPEPDEGAIERALVTHQSNVVTEGLIENDTWRTRAKCNGNSCDFYVEHPSYTEAMAAHSAHVAEVITALLASPVQPGRSEADVVESWRDLHAHRRGVVLDRDGRVWQSDVLGTWWSAVDRECHGPANLFAARRPLTWLHRAARVADTTDTEGDE